MIPITENDVLVDEVIYHLKCNILTELRPSRIHGVGVFALVDIPKDTYIFPKWSNGTGIYRIPKNKLNELPEPVINMIDSYFIDDDSDHKIIRLINGLNFLFHSPSFCNTSYPIKENQNVDGFGKTLCDIKKGEEILEWYP
jgi:SET domain-containing protein